MYFLSVYWGLLRGCFKADSDHYVYQTCQPAGVVSIDLGINSWQWSPGIGL